MKKRGFLIALLAILLILVSALDWGLPTQQLVPGPVNGEENRQIAAENRALTSRVYTLRDGLIQEIVRESRYHDGVESRIVRVAFDAETQTIYYVRVLGDGSVWELVEQNEKSNQIVSQGIFENGQTVTGLTAENGTVWITAVGENQAPYVYEYIPGGETKLKMIIPVLWLRDIVSAEFDGTKFRVSTEYDEHAFLTPTGEKTYTEEAAEQPLPVITINGAGWLLCKGPLLLAAVLLWLVVALSLMITDAMSRRAERLATRLTAVGGEVLLLALLAVLGSALYIVLHQAGLVEAMATFRVLLPVLAVVWLASVLLLRQVAGRVTGPIARMTRQMNEIADGTVKPRQAEAGNDELHQMDRTMQEMCMGLSIRDYEMNSTIQSYKRFVPGKLTQLLGRANVSEVELGDSCRVESNVGLFSVGNRADARGALEDAAFVDFINYSFGIFHDCVEENHGCMISSALKLSLMETIFPDSAADGVQAGLDFLGRTRKHPEADVPAPAPLLILHRGSFLYGVAGKDSRLFPYVSSAEMEFLSHFSQRFYETGTRIVATQSYWKQLENSGFTGRYIGFVSDGEKNAYKLYEVLDAYPELERKLRSGYDQRFQEAIDLFYHNDFYLARNLFSSLLRVCPEDGIVRWYLFACERFFNQAGEQEVDYRLFGIEALQA